MKLNYLLYKVETKLSIWQQIYYFNAGMKGFKKSMSYKRYFEALKMMAALLISTSGRGKYLTPRASYLSRSIFDRRTAVLTY